MNVTDNIEHIVSAFSSISLQNNNQSQAMATINSAKEIAHTLKTFSGKPEHLEYFIQAVDKFYNRYYETTTDESLREFVFASICSKIIDQAGDYLLCHPELQTWPLIKIELRRVFGDKINRHTLSQQLNFLTRNKNESTLEFVDRLKILKNRINLKINSEPLLQATKTALIEQNEQTAVTVLLANVSSELRTILLINNHHELDDTYNTILNHSLIEQQLGTRNQMLRNTNNSQQNVMHKPHQPQQKPQNNAFLPSTNSYRPYFQTMPSTSKQQFPSQPINIQPRPVQHRFFTNQQVFGKPQNAFQKPNPHARFDRPTPMSGVSIIPRSSQRPLPQQNDRQNFWKNNPHANPLQFTEITHLEENDSAHNPHENPSNEYYEQFSYETPEVDYSNLENYKLDYNYEGEEISYQENQNENFQNPASPKDRPS